MILYPLTDHPGYARDDEGNLWSLPRRAGNRTTKLKKKAWTEDRGYNHATVRGRTIKKENLPALPVCGILEVDRRGRLHLLNGTIPEIPPPEPSAPEEPAPPAASDDIRHRDDELRAGVDPDFYFWQNFHGFRADG